jgi:hypothetical protein
MSNETGIPAKVFYSAVRSAGDLAGVFECDDEVGYFYLYGIDPKVGDRVIDSIRISAGSPTFKQDDVKIEWFDDESLVALRIKGVVCGLFDCVKNTKFGGDYAEEKALALPADLLRRLAR